MPRVRSVERRATRSTGAGPDRPAAPADLRESEALLAFAAVALVMGSRYQPRFLFFPVQAFYAGLLFFAVGHAATEAGGGGLSRLRSLSRTWLGPLYAANLSFAILTLVLARAGLGPGGSVPSFVSAAAALASLKQLLFAPFGAGEAYALFQPGWLLAQLFLVSALAALAGSARSRLALLAVVALSAVAALALLGEGGATRWPALLAGRTAYALVFYLAGYLVKTASEAVRRRLFTPLALVGSFVVADFLIATFGVPTDSLERGSLGEGSALPPLLIAAACVLLVCQLAHYAALIAGPRSLLFAVGRAWRAILIGLSSAFFATNCALVLLGYVRRDALSVANSFSLNRTWLFYLVPAVALPVLACAVARRASKPATRQAPA